MIDVADRTSEVGYVLGGHLPLASDGSGKLAGVVLDILQVRLDLGAKLLQVLHNRRLNGARKRGVGIRDEPCLVADGVEHVLRLFSTARSTSTITTAHLHATFPEELVSGPERHLDHRTKLGELFRRVGLDVSDALEVRCVPSEPYSLFFNANQSTHR